MPCSSQLGHGSAAGHRNRPPSFDSSGFGSSENRGCSRTATLMSAFNSGAAFSTSAGGFGVVRAAVGATRNRCSSSRCRSRAFVSAWMRVKSSGRRRAGPATVGGRSRRRRRRSRQERLRRCMASTFASSSPRAWRWVWPCGEPASRASPRRRRTTASNSPGGPSAPPAVGPPGTPAPAARPGSCRRSASAATRPRPRRSSVPQHRPLEHLVQEPGEVRVDDLASRRRSSRNSTSSRSILPSSVTARRMNSASAASMRPSFRSSLLANAPVHRGTSGLLRDLLPRRHVRRRAVGQLGALHHRLATASGAGGCSPSRPGPPPPSRPPAPPPRSSPRPRPRRCRRPAPACVSGSTSIFVSPSVRAMRHRPAARRPRELQHLVRHVLLLRLRLRQPGPGDLRVGEDDRRDRPRAPLGRLARGSPRPPPGPRPSPCGPAPAPRPRRRSRRCAARSSAAACPPG